MTPTKFLNDLVSLASSSESSHIRSRTGTARAGKASRPVPVETRVPIKMTPPQRPVMRPMSSFGHLKRSLYK
jgi:hypothetical protein